MQGIDAEIMHFEKSSGRRYPSNTMNTRRCWTSRSKLCDETGSLCK